MQRVIISEWRHLSSGARRPEFVRGCHLDLYAGLPNRLLNAFQIYILEIDNPFETKQFFINKKINLPLP